MIKFFRNIRRQLLTVGLQSGVNGKFSRYMMYALGEIFLVVIGILIALSINQWNDQKKNSALELHYYNRILDDFELDKQLIAELMAKADTRIANSKKLLLDLDAGNRDKKYLLNSYLVTLRSDAYVPRNVTYKDLISSGNLKLLKDVIIKNSLIQYYSELENKQAQLKQNRDEIVKETFKLINSSIQFGGIQEFEYVNRLLEPEILQTFPQRDWTKDKNSEHYQNFQMMLLFNIAMSDREKQHLSAIRQLMEVPYQLLDAKRKTR